LSNNIILETNTNSTKNKKKTKTLSITNETYERLAAYGHWSENANELINRLLDNAELGAKK
jgi:hypothetical protein